MSNPFFYGGSIPPEHLTLGSLPPISFRRDAMPRVSTMETIPSSFSHFTLKFREAKL